MERSVINPWKWQDQYGFVQGNRVTEAQRFLWCSGQTSVDGNGSPLHAGDMAAQLNQAFDNVETVLKEAGFKLSDIVRLNYYTTDLAAFAKAGGTLAERMREAGCKPATTLLGVAGLFHPDILVEIEVTAMA
jgi:enamine deaminase RidA (YjgF/YER057c/UK114 family)